MIYDFQLTRLKDCELWVWFNSKFWWVWVLTISFKINSLVALLYCKRRWRLWLQWNCIQCHSVTWFVETEASSYLADPDRCLEILHEYPLVKSAFIHFNTTIPSSASVERLFSSVDGQTEKARWNRLSDTNSEKLLLLKANDEISYTINNNNSNTIIINWWYHFVITVHFYKVWLRRAMKTCLTWWFNSISHNSFYTGWLEFEVHFVVRELNFYLTHFLSEFTQHWALVYTVCLKKKHPRHF